MKAETLTPPAFIMEEEASLGLPPLTSQRPGGSGEDINIFISATAVPGLCEMSLVRNDAGKELVEQEHDGGGRGQCRIRCNSATGCLCFPQPISLDPW